MTIDGEVELLQAVRDADWASVRQLLRVTTDLRPDLVESTPLWLWLVSANAPPDLPCLAIRAAAAESVGRAVTDTLAFCMGTWITRSQARETFKLILEDCGLPSELVSGGNTLLQEAIRLNRPDCAAELLRAGADPFQRSAHGDESTSALEDAIVARNQTAGIVLRAVGKTGVTRYLRSQERSLRSPNHAARRKFEYYGWLSATSHSDPWDIWDYAFGIERPTAGADEDTHNSSESGRS